MKTLLIAAVAFLLIGAWPPILAPAALVADGIAATVTQLPWWFLLMALGAGLAHQHLTRPRVRVIRGHATRKA